MLESTPWLHASPDGSGVPGPPGGGAGSPLRGIEVGPSNRGEVSRLYDWFVTLLVRPNALLSSICIIRIPKLL